MHLKNLFLFLLLMSEPIQSKRSNFEEVFGSKDPSRKKKSNKSVSTTEQASSPIAKKPAWASGQKTGAILNKASTTVQSKKEQLNSPQIAAMLFSKDLPTQSMYAKTIDQIYGKTGANIAEDVVVNIKQTYCYFEFLVKLDKVVNDKKYEEFQTDFQDFLQPRSDGLPLMPTQDLVTSLGWKNVAITEQDLVESLVWQNFIHAIICDSMQAEKNFAVDVVQTNNEMGPYLQNIEATYSTNEFTRLRLYEESIRVQSYLRSDQRNKYIAQSTKWKNFNTKQLMQGIEEFVKTDFYIKTHSAPKQAGDGAVVATPTPLRENIVCYCMLMQIQSTVYGLMTQKNLQSILSLVQKLPLSANFFSYSPADYINLYDCLITKQLIIDNKAKAKAAESTLAQAKQNNALPFPKYKAINSVSKSNFGSKSSGSFGVDTQTAEDVHAQASSVIFKQLPITSSFEKIIDSIYGSSGLNIPVEQLEYIKKTYCYLEFLCKLDKVKNDGQYRQHQRKDFKNFMQPKADGTALLPTQALVTSDSWKAINVSNQDIVASAAWQNFVKSMVCDQAKQQADFIVDSSQADEQMFGYLANIETAYSTNEFTEFRLYGESLRIRDLLLEEQGKRYLEQCPEWKNLDSKALQTARAAFQKTLFYELTHDGPTGTPEEAKQKYLNIQSPTREHIVSQFLLATIQTDVFAILTPSNLLQFLTQASSTQLTPNFFSYNLSDYIYLYDQLAVNDLVEKQKDAPESSLDMINGFDDDSADDEDTVKTQFLDETEEDVYEEENYDTVNEADDVIIQKIDSIQASLRKTKRATQRLNQRTKRFDKRLKERNKRVNARNAKNFGKAMLALNKHLAAGFSLMVGMVVFTGTSIGSLFNKNIHPLKLSARVIAKIDAHAKIIGLVLTNILVAMVIAVIVVVTAGAASALVGMLTPIVAPAFVAAGNAATAAASAIGLGSSAGAVGAVGAGAGATAVVAGAETAAVGATVATTAAATTAGATAATTAATTAAATTWAGAAMNAAISVGQTLMTPLVYASNLVGIASAASASGGASAGLGAVATAIGADIAAAAIAAPLTATMIFTGAVVGVAAASDKNFRAQLMTNILLPIMKGMEAMTVALTQGLIELSVGLTYLGAAYEQSLGYPINAKQQAAKVRKKMNACKSTINEVMGVVLTIVITVALYFIAPALTGVINSLRTSMWSTQAITVAAAQAAAETAASQAAAQLLVKEAAQKSLAAAIKEGASQATQKAAQKTLEVAAKKAAQKELAATAAQATLKTAIKKGAATLAANEASLTTAQAAKTFAQQSLDDAILAEAAAKKAAETAAKKGITGLYSSTVEKEAYNAAIKETAAKRLELAAAEQAEKTIAKRVAQGVIEKTEGEAALKAAADKAAAKAVKDTAAKQAVKSAKAPSKPPKPSNLSKAVKTDVAAVGESVAVNPISKSQSLSKIMSNALKIAKDQTFSLSFLLGQGFNVIFAVFSITAAVNQDTAAIEKEKQEEESIQSLWKFIEDSKVNVVQTQEEFLSELHKKHLVAVQSQALNLRYYQNYLNSSINNASVQIGQSLAQQQIALLTPDSNGLKSADIGSTWGLQTPFVYLYPSQGFISTTLGRPDFPYAQEVAQAPLAAQAKVAKPVDLSDNQESATKLWFNQRAMTTLRQAVEVPLNVEIKFRILYTLNSAYHLGLYLGGNYHDYNSAEYLKSLQADGTIDMNDAHLAKMFVIKRDNGKAAPQIGIYENEGLGWIAQQPITDMEINNAAVYHMMANLDKTQLKVSFWSQDKPDTKWTQTMTVTACNQRTFGIIFSGAAIEWNVVQPSLTIKQNQQARVASNGQSEIDRERESKAIWKKLLQPKFGFVQLQSVGKIALVQGQYLYTSKDTNLVDEQNNPIIDYLVFATMNKAGTDIENIGMSPVPSDDSVVPNVLVSLVSGKAYDVSRKVIANKKNVLAAYQQVNGSLSSTVATAVQAAIKSYAAGQTVAAQSSTPPVPEKTVVALNTLSLSQLLNAVPPSTGGQQIGLSNIAPSVMVATTSSLSKLQITAAGSVGIQMNDFATAA